MNSIRVDDFNLAATLESGQIFRYVRTTTGYLVHQRNRIFKVWQEGCELHFEGAEGPFIRHYFGLDKDYKGTLRTLVEESVVQRAAEVHWGLRILRQDPWECLVSFLCSSTKNIAHIKVLIERLCRAFGDPVSFGNYHGYAFPREGEIQDLRRLQAMGLGYRAEYVYAANRIAGKRYFEDILGKPYEEAKALLMDVPGVGEKVADCVLLFSLGFTQAFPVDTWIKKGMEEIYFQGQSTSAKKIGAFGRKRFGQFAGYAQQFLYHHWRENAKVSSGGRSQGSGVRSQKSE